MSTLKPYQVILTHSNLRTSIIHFGALPLVLITPHHFPFCHAVAPERNVRKCINYYLWLRYGVAVTLMFIWSTWCLMIFYICVSLYIFSLLCIYDFVCFGRKTLKRTINLSCVYHTRNCTSQILNAHNKILKFNELEYPPLKGIIFDIVMNLWSKLVKINLNGWG